MLSERELNLVIAKANRNAQHCPNLARDILSVLLVASDSDLDRQFKNLGLLKGRAVVRRCHELVRELVTRPHACGPDCLCKQILKEIGAA